MSKLRRKFITVLAVLFCALLALSTALMIPKNKTADAYVNSPTTDVNELYNSSTGGFSAKNLTTLYGELVSNATKIGDIKDALDNNAEITVANKDIIVEFGGMKWLAVYLSKATRANAGTDGPDKGRADNGNIVLTLWLANSVGNEQFSTWTNLANTESYTYPGNMYGTSYMRSVVLGNGGQYWNGTNWVTASPQTTFSDLIATSTSTSATPSKGDYLVAPRYIAWQYRQNAMDLINYANDLNNEAWGAESLSASEITRRFKKAYFGNIEHYSDWKDDLIWIPSLTEAGYGPANNSPNDGYNGIWNTTSVQRKSQSTPAWLRSCDEAGPAKLYCVDATAGDQNNAGWIVRYPTEEMAVRPAIHLNLTKADGSAKSVSYDNVELENVDESSREVANDENDHTFAHVYDGETNTVSVTLGDIANLEQLGTTPSGATFVNGVFKATYPDDHDDKTYTITVKPKTGYVWYDNDNPDEERTYSIKIEATPIKVDWNSAITGNLNGTLLQDTTKVTSEKFTSGVNFTQKFYKIEPNVSDKSLPSNPTWTTRDDLSSYFKASQAGLYYMYYQIEAMYHKTTTVTNYTVNVSSDTIHFKLSDDIEIKKTFGSDKAAALRDSLKDKIEEWVSDGLMTVKGQPSNKVYQDTDLESLLANLEVVLLDDNMMEANPADGHDYYSAGDYKLHIRYKDTVSADSRTLNFEWDDGKRPTLKIEKKKIAVDIVAATAGDSLEHVYGSFNKDLLAYKIPDGVIPDGENENDLKIRKGVFRIVKEDGTLGDELSNSTPAGTYKIKGVAQNSNYDVDFEPVTYKVTKLKITLQVADETVEYGTDFTNHTYNDLIKTGTDLINGDTLSQVTTSKRYYILINGGEIELSSTLAIGEYVLCAEITSDNYEFEVTAGKLTITKANFKMAGVKLNNEGYIYNGEPHPAKLVGELPSDEITVSFRYVNYDTGEELDGPPVEVGLYLVYASFTHDNSNYNVITEVKAAYIRIAYTQDELNQPYPPLPTDAELAAAADLAKKKTEAKKTLDEEAQKKKDEIDADVNLSAEEKKAAKDEIDKELKEGNAAIDKAKDKDSVDKAYDDGKKEIEDTTELAKKKGAAKSELDKAAQAKKDAIDANPELTDEEKAAAKAEVDKELEEGKKAIDGANSIDGVSSAESSTKTNIENIKAEHKGSFPWWILAIIAGALVLVVVVIIVVVKRRGSDDDDGYDDYYDDEYDYDEEEIDDDGDEAYGF